MADEKTSGLSSITGANLADTDLVMVVDVSDPTMAATGTNKKVTLDEFAQDSVFSSRYASISGQQVTIGAGAMASYLGSPSLAASGDGARWSGWLFDASSQEGVVLHLDVPATWTTVNAYLYWINAGAGAGDVRWGVTVDRAGNGDTLSTGRAAGGNYGATVTAGAQDVMTVTQVLTTQAIDNTKLCNVRIIRIATDAADTLANDVQVFALVVERAS